MVVHSYPHGYFAADAFWGHNNVNNVYESGQTLYVPDYQGGGFDYIITHHYPLILQTAAFFAHASGLQVHDALFLFGNILIILTALIMYVLIRELNKNIAIIGASLMAFILTGTFSIVALFGKYGSITGNLFLIASFWVMSRWKLKKVWLLFGIILAGVFLGHPSETLYSTALIALWLGLRFVTKQFSWNDIKKVALAGVIALLLSAHFMYILSYTELQFRKSEYPTFSPILTDVNPSPAVGEFGLFGILIAAGIVLAILLMVQRKKIETPVVAALFLLIITYSNYIGMFRAFQLRYHWPIYLALFVGLAAYQLGRMILKKWNGLYSIGISVGLILLFLFVNYEPIRGTGIADADSWNAFMSIRHNAEPDDVVLFLYGERYQPEPYDFNTHRLGYKVDNRDYLESLPEEGVKI